MHLQCRPGTRMGTKWAFYLWLIEVGKIKVQIEKKLNKRKVKEKKYNNVRVKGLV